VQAYSQPVAEIPRNHSKKIFSGNRIFVPPCPL
jgi:hypothetical protein